MNTELAHSPVRLILGPHQGGQTTFAQMLGQRQAGSHFDLESPRDWAHLARPPTGLEAARGSVVLDEIQQRPDLLPLRRVLTDRKPLPYRFLLLGSASRKRKKIYEAADATPGRGQGGLSRRAKDYSN